MRRFAILVAVGLWAFSTTAATADGGMPVGLPTPVHGEARVYALAPGYLFNEDGPFAQLDPQSLEQLHADYIVASAAVGDLAEIVDALNEAFDPAAPGALCFDPRHGLRYRSEWGEVIALVCFKCHKTFVVIEGWMRYFTHGHEAVELLQFARAAMEDAGARYPDLQGLH
jgi:hypothetical protein